MPDKKRRRVKLLTAALAVLAVWVAVYKPWEFHDRNRSQEFFKESWANKDGGAAALRILEDDWDVNTPIKVGTDLGFYYSYPLAEACRWLNYDVIKRLIEKGADPNLYSSDWHPVAATLTGAWKYPAIKDIMLLLFESGADITELTGNKSPLGCFVSRTYYLHEEYEVEQRLDVLKTLINNGANPKDTYLLSSLAENNRVEMLKYLIEDCGYNVNDTNLKGVPLYGAVQGGAYEAAEYLISVGADKSRKYDPGYGKPILTAFELAEQLGDERMIEILGGE